MAGTLLIGSILIFAYQAVTYYGLLNVSPISLFGAVQFQNMELKDTLTAMHEVACTWSALCLIVGVVLLVLKDIEYDGLIKFKRHIIIYAWVLFVLCLMSII